MKASFLAATTILAWLYGVASMVVAFSDNVIEHALDKMYPAIALIAVLGFAAYIVDAIRSDRVPMEKRALWAVVLFLGHFFAQPFYWWWYVRPQNPNSPLHQ